MRRPRRRARDGTLPPPGGGFRRTGAPPRRRRCPRIPRSRSNPRTAGRTSRPRPHARTPARRPGSGSCRPSGRAARLVWPGTGPPSEPGRPLQRGQPIGLRDEAGRGHPVQDRVDADGQVPGLSTPARSRAAALSAPGRPPAITALRPRHRGGGLVHLGDQPSLSGCAHPSRSRSPSFGRAVSWLRYWPTVALRHRGQVSRGGARMFTRSVASHPPVRQLLSSRWVGWGPGEARQVTWARGGSTGWIPSGRGPRVSVSPRKGTRGPAFAPSVHVIVTLFSSRPAMRGGNVISGPAESTRTAIRGRGAKRGRGAARCAGSASPCSSTYIPITMT